jgi:hypothetical protein
MREKTELLEQSWQEASLKPALFALVTLCVSLVLIFKAPSLWAILIPEF